MKQRTGNFTLGSKLKEKDVAFIVMSRSWDKKINPKKINPLSGLMELFRTADHGLSPFKKSPWPNSSQQLVSQKSF